jgi:hypothetical protein
MAANTRDSEVLKDSEEFKEVNKGLEDKRLIIEALKTIDVSKVAEATASVAIWLLASWIFVWLWDSLGRLNLPRINYFHALLFVWLIRYLTGASRSNWTK